jgi:putative hydrolase of the HAD superfamily
VKEQLPLSTTLTTIGFDADDTLWQNEQFFQLTQQRLIDLLKDHADPGRIRQSLLDVSLRNLEHHGFGIKSFTLAMIETAIEVTDGRVPATAVKEILGIGRELSAHPVETLPHARETLESLAGRYRILLITKGELFDQERKLAQSGLGELFDGVEIVSQKTAATYIKVFARHGGGAEKSMMVGNSLRSDVLPAIEAGSWGIFVPHELTWAAEHAEEPADSPRFRKVEHLGKLIPLIEEIG